MPLTAVWIELALAHALFFRLLRAIKYRDVPQQQPMTRDDYFIALMFSATLTLLVSLHSVAALASAALATLLFFFLWLDAALYHLFTFELGADGIGGVVLSNLLTEVLRMHRARSFFRRHLGFTLLPLGILGAHLLLVLDRGSALHAQLAIGLAGYLVLAASAANTPLLSRSAQDRRRALLHDLLRPRRPHIPTGFQPTAEHAARLNMLPRIPAPSLSHGSVEGASVVFLTFESLGSSSLSSLRKDASGACTPFLDALQRSENTIRSEYHCCLAPLTNAAHVALYAADYVAPSMGTGDSTHFLHSLRRAGYETLYLTAAVGAHYGLARLLRQVGFQHIIDGSRLGPHPLDGGQLSDYALLEDGLRCLRPLLSDSSRRPFFLHIHLANTHVPYRVIDAARFHRHDPDSDHGRFLNGIEESDWILSELWTALRALAVRRPNEKPPLLIVSSDHGQAFGEHGYWTHGSSVTDEEIRVPLLLHHPDLASRVVPFSTHFDVLPTVLDLLGCQVDRATLGVSLCAAEQAGRADGCLLWDGRPSRSTSSCLGVLLGDRKYALDLVRDTCLESGWRDENPRLLVGAERACIEALIGHMAKQRGIL